MIVYALDIGGSSVKHALINAEQGHAHMVRAYQSLPLQSRDFADLERQVTASVCDILRANASVDTVAVSTTGAVDEKGIVINAGHFNGYSNVSWEDTLRKQTDRLKRVITMNDGRASAWAEFVGGGDDVSFLAHFVVGTGIGGATIVDKRLVLGETGYAGYLGHIKVTSENTPRCSCGEQGCVETVGSAPGIIHYFEENRELAGSADPITLEAIVAAACAGDKTAVKAFEVAGAWLGVAVSNVMNILNPGVVTLGGGVVLAAKEIGAKQHEDPFFAAVVRSAQSRAHRRVAATAEIRRATYGNDGGLIGAALMASSVTNQ